MSIAALLGTRMMLKSTKAKIIMYEVLVGGDRKRCSSVIENDRTAFWRVVMIAVLKTMPTVLVVMGGLVFYGSSAVKLDGKDNRGDCDGCTAASSLKAFCCVGKENDTTVSDDVILFSKEPSLQC